MLRKKKARRRLVEKCSQADRQTHCGPTIRGREKRVASLSGSQQKQQKDDRIT